ncbi:hypothetical protein Riv7116_1454 [Rivularia sp. PCC 7116]|uniref:hypothetical protein n=1 Tax=Rivularia sp. PCC 7116 TaxID=373994 RepID=UPI00029EE380|nr:hypothetical protein [Rivularia sp. PCC 7116]AFY54016.1 hypothetical protein Riv7116_1454 [Rivularia sp. PCC 7116]
MAEALEKKASSSQSSISISPDGTETRESQATVKVDDGTGNTETKSVSVSDSNPGGENPQNAADAMNDSAGGASDENSTDASNTINDLTNSAPSEDVSEARQTESLQKQSLQQQALTTQSFINNGSFEGNSLQPGEGTFERWRTIGDTSIETKEIGIAPTDKESQALITNGFSDSGGSVEESDLSEFFDLSSGTLDALLGGNATEGSGIKQQITAQAGDILEFDYTFLTNEATPTKTFNDSAFFSLGKFAQELTDTSDPTFSSDKNVQGYSEATDTQSLKILISQAGTYDLGFGIVDLTDTIVNSAILIDDVKLTSTGVTPFESQTIEGSDATKTDAAISSDVDLTFGTNGFEAARDSSNPQ